MTMQIAYMRQPVLWHILLARLSSRQVYMGLLVPKYCIGLPPAIKQWGYNSTSFAISFNNSCYFVIPAFNGNADNYYGFNITGKNNAGFTYGRHGGITGTISYIAGGI